MFQLKFTADFKDTYLDIPYWQVIEDIPKIIQDWIKEDTHEIIIHNQKTLKYYCPNCLNELEEDKSCSVCHLNYASNTDCLEIYANELKDIVLNKAYYVFDIVNNHPYLYEIKEKITYNNNLTLMPFKMAKLTITKAFLVEKNGLRDLINQEFISFNFLASYHKTFNEESDPFLNNNSKKDYELYEQIVLDGNYAYVYPSNLLNLKNTIYKYSKIWNLSTIQKHNYYTIANLTFYPLYYPQFEYLVNYKLDNLALTDPSYFNHGTNFKEIFGLEKSFLPFMVKCNIDFCEYRILKLSKIKDYETLKFFAQVDYFYSKLEKLVIDYKVNLQVLKDYLFLLANPTEYLAEYLDYIDMALKLKLDLKNKRILYPKDLDLAHGNLYNQIEIIENPDINEKIALLSEVLKLNTYEDENYIIFPASSLDDLILESKQQHNCVRMYAQRIINHECQIYFMRKKNNPLKSLVTIEVANNKIIQARVKYNKLPDDEIRKILTKWEKQLVPLIIQN